MEEPCSSRWVGTGSRHPTWEMHLLGFRPVERLAPILKKPQKTFCYVDGFNLFCGFFKDEPKSPPENKWLDIKKLLRELLPSHYLIAKVKYFSAKYPNEYKAKRLDTYWQALRTTGVEIVEGRFSASPKTSEKQTDVNLACSMLVDCFTEESLDCVVLVSNDSDFKMPLKLAREKFRKRVFVFSPQKAAKKNN